MDSIVRRLSSTSDSGLLVEGHAEPFEVPRGEPNPQQYLLRLSQRRAEAAYALLLRKGIPESRLTTFGYGGKRPAAPSDTPEHRQLNRRVEFKTVGLEFIPSKEEKLRMNGPSKTAGQPTKKPTSQGSKHPPSKRPALLKSSSHPSKSRR